MDPAPFKRGFQELWVASAGAVAWEVFLYIRDRVLVKTPQIEAFALSLVAAATTLALLITIPYLCSQISWFRRIIFPYSKLEGYWLQEVPIPERPWSVASIDKEPLGHWIYRGDAYSQEGELTASWKGADLEYDSELEAWIFKGVSGRYDNERFHRRHGNVLSILYWGEFSSDPEISSAKLKGRFADLDFNDKPTAHNLVAVRITREDWRFAGLLKPNTKLNRDQFIRLRDNVRGRGPHIL